MIKSFLNKIFQKKEKEYESIDSIPKIIVAKETINTKSKIELPQNKTKEFAKNINSSAKKGLLELQQEYNSLKKEISEFEVKISKVKNDFMLKQYNEELKQLRKKKILCETSMDARKRHI